MPERWRRFPVVLTAIAVAGFVLRVVVIVTTRGDEFPGGDGFYYYVQGQALANGDGFVDAFVYRYADAVVQAAHHPPLFSVYLGIASFLGLSGPEVQRILCALAGAVTIVLIGLVGRRLGGERTGLIAAGLAAVYPNLWANDALLLSESLYTVFIAWALLAAYRFWDDPRARTAIVLGVAIAGAALTRAEASNLVLFLAIPLVFFLKLGWQQRLKLGAIAVATTVVVVSPWVIHNLVRFERPVALSYGAAGVLPQANCDQTYEGRLLGYWNSRECAFPDAEMVPEFFSNNPDPEVAAQQALEVLRDEDESEIAQDGQKRGLDYIRAHKGRAVVVAAARVGRVWGVFRPGQSITLDTQVENRNHTASVLGLVLYYELLVLAVFGLVVLRRRKEPILPFVALAVMVTFTAAVAIGITRYRIPVDVGLVILAAVAIDEGIRRYRRAER